MYITAEVRIENLRECIVMMRDVIEDMKKIPSFDKKIIEDSEKKLRKMEFDLAYERALNPEI